MGARILDAERYTMPVPVRGLGRQVGAGDGGTWSNEGEEGDTPGEELREGARRDGTGTAGRSRVD